ncbi:GIY-YIG nuclease family protein [Gordonia sp. UCD-TK1]|uniref:GIY-YIG nuclease family protein n=1 Tax=Gordonia sp. UCD-TK1 TaxID=1857893 RepID=UPI00080E3FB6|nr:GIY-YIG nuclease family protein [Gordonia sp. UCD-TK1]OCH81360.1 hypothetical protein A9310_17725 [Gordonia sp. UCD-TK1]
MLRPQTIQIYLPSGSPSGIRVASLTTRTVRVFEVPRPLLADFLKLSEASQVGVYCLLGSETGELGSCYIGQTGNVGDRLQQHAKSKEFWTTAMVAVSLTNEWTSTHVAYLEWLSINRAASAGRYKLVNGNQASNPHTPAPLEADCHEFLDTIAVLLATLGAPVLEPPTKPESVPVMTNDGNGTGSTLTSEQSTQQELLHFRDGGCDATGYLTSEGFLVLEGSRGRAQTQPSIPGSALRLREALEKDGIIAVEGAEIRFLRDHLLRSPSSAGSVLAGGSVNGRRSWKNARGQDVNYLENQALSAAALVTGRALVEGN